MAAKTSESKAIEKQTKEAKKNAQKAARVERAKSVVALAEIRDGLVIIDDDSKIFLTIALEKFDGNESNRVTIESTDVPAHLMYNLSFESEKLFQYGLISSYIPLGGSVIITLSTAGKKYFDRVKMQENEGDNTRNEIFISHRAKDKIFAEMIQDFFVGCGVPKDLIFCSSLPGNDVNEQIPQEVKTHLQHSAVNVLILSNSYYESYYCMNEAGIIWFTSDVSSVVPIGLPDVNFSNMVGFIDSSFIMRRIDSGTDMTHVLDIIQKKLSLDSVSHTVVMSEIEKLQKKYFELMGSYETTSDNTSPPEKQYGSLSDDAILLLLYASISECRIMKIEVLSGTLIGVDGYQFTNGTNSRSKARWINALEELVDNNYVRAVGEKQEIFEITKLGFDLVDKLQTSSLSLVINESPKSYYENNIKESNSQ